MEVPTPWVGLELSPKQRRPVISGTGAEDKQAGPDGQSSVTSSVFLQLLTFRLILVRSAREMLGICRIAHTIRPYKICVQTTHVVAYKIPHKLAYKIGSPAQGKGGFPMSV